MSQSTSRKQFFAKLAGTAAALAVTPKIFAQSTSATAPAAPGTAIKLRPDTRAVARRAGTV